MFTHRIRRCSGNRKAWLLATLRPDGTELDSYGSYWTAYEVDHLMIRAAAHIGPEARIEFLWSID